MENFKTENRYLKRVQGCYLMYEDCFLQNRLSETLNVFVDQKTRSSICFKTCGRDVEAVSRAFETLDRAFKTLGRALEGLRDN